MKILTWYAYCNCCLAVPFPLLYCISLIQFVSWPFLLLLQASLFFYCYKLLSFLWRCNLGAMLLLLRHLSPILPAHNWHTINWQCLCNCFHNLWIFVENVTVSDQHHWQGHQTTQESWSKQHQQPVFDTNQWLVRNTWKTRKSSLLSCKSQRMLYLKWLLPQKSSHLILGRAITPVLAEQPVAPWVKSHWSNFLATF